MTTYQVDVSGMSCDHCERAVGEELDALPAVESVVIELVPDGTSTVTVQATAPLLEADVRDAIDEAGYEFLALKEHPVRIASD